MARHTLVDCEAANVLRFVCKMSKMTYPSPPGPPRH